MAKLKFDPVEHKYTMGGFVIPNVTSVVERFLPYGNMPDDLRRAALERGTLVHAITEWLDRNKPITASWLIDVDDAGLRGYFEAWKAFKRDYDVAILSSEQRVYHDQYRYAGTLDRTGIYRIKGKDYFGLIEIKTGSLIDEYALQTAAYFEAYNNNLDPLDKLDKRLIVCLREDGTYRAEVHEDKLDWPAFVGALNIYNWRLSHGRKS